MHQTPSSISGIAVTRKFFRSNLKFILFTLIKKSCGITVKKKNTGQPSVGVLQLRHTRYMHFGTANTQSKINLRAPYQLQGYPATIMGVLLFTDQPQNILMIGLGGGDLVRFIYKNIPSIRLTTVEIHPEVVEIARAYFLVPQDDERCNIITGDGVAYIQSEVSTADILIIDAFDGSVVAEPTTTLDFYQQCARALTSNGIMVVNLLPNHTLPVYLERIKQVFNHVICLTATQYNAVVFAFKKPPNEVDSQALYEKARQLTQDYGLNFMEIAKKLTCCKIPLK